MTVQSCPECRAGKHGNCNGTAWDLDADQPAWCPCECRTGPVLGVAYPEQDDEG